MIEQKYIVLLGDRDGRQLWLAYDANGRIGNATYTQAFRYGTEQQAHEALRRVRSLGARWPGAKIFGTTVDTSDGSR